MDDSQALQQQDAAQTYHVAGDVGLATGEIEFEGSVIVEGDVNTGCRIEAGGDVEVRGSVYGGIVEARGNVTVQYGITHQARVTAGGNVRAKFVEYSEVKASAHVWASDGIVQSTIVAGGKVEALGRYGAIVGGHVNGRLGVSAREVGSPSGVPTSIVAGVAPDLLAKLERLRDEAKALDRRAAGRREQLREFARQVGDGSLGKFGTHQMRTVMAELQAIDARREQLELRHRALLVTQSAVDRAVVEARERCHADVRVTIGSGTYGVHHARAGVRFSRSRQGLEMDVVTQRSAAAQRVPVAR
jgi:uncharacterized protein (DUF342 family)